MRREVAGNVVAIDGPGNREKHVLIPVGLVMFIIFSLIDIHDTVEFDDGELAVPLACIVDGM